MRSSARNAPPRPTFRSRRFIRRRRRKLTQAYNWTGFYFGANGGGGWGHSCWSANATGIDLSGGLVGGTAGYNWQAGKVVFGLEGDLDWSGLSGTHATTRMPAGLQHERQLALDRARPPRLFVRPVYALCHRRTCRRRHPRRDARLRRRHTTNAGWTVGGGLEVALPGNWSAKAEYLRVDLGKFNCTGCSALPTDNVSMQENVFRAGLNYRFGWGK